MESLLTGEQLRERRKQAGLSQKQAAEAADASQATISRWEAGTEQPSYGNLKILIEAYGGKISDLLPRNQYRSAPLDPEQRQDHFRRRNAAIQHVDVDVYMGMMRDQDQRTQRFAAEAAKEKKT